MNYHTAVIGAGPAGIATVGKLLDHGIAAKDIVWIDPHFQVGDFGTIWKNVPSNTTVNLFLQFLHAAQSFDYDHSPHDFEINHLDPYKTCYLRIMVEPLQWITDHLRKKIHSMHDIAENLSLKDRQWTIQLKKTEIHAKNVILAIGSESKNLSYSAFQVIPLQDALDEQRIKNHINPKDGVAVFGSSHSGILVLRNLVNCKVKQIINFYQSPLRYAVNLDDWILFDDTGLKGIAAEWARENIDGQLPHNLERIYSNTENIEHYLPLCNKVVYAIGFERRLLPTIHGGGPLSYIEECGIIAPGLFGIGIAFPEAKWNPFGLLEHRVGLAKFMDYLERILPVWLKYFV